MMRTASTSWSIPATISRVETVDVYAGGTVQIGSYSFVQYANFHGGTIKDGGHAYNARNISCYASDETARIGVNWKFDGSDRSISVERGTCPVDLIIQGSGLSDGNTGKTITKSGDGVVKSKVNFGGLMTHFKIEAAELLAGQLCHGRDGWSRQAH